MTRKQDICSHPKATAPTDSTLDLFTQAKALQQQGELAGALNAYQEVLQIQPNWAEACYRLGLIHKALGHLEAACDAYQKALDLDPTLACAHTNLGNILAQQGQRAEAVLHYQQALALEVDSGLYSNLGLVLQELGRREEAQACYHKALELNPELAQVHNNLGTLLYQERRLLEAQACYEKALALRPELPQAHYNLGRLYHERQQIEAAIACYQQAITLQPNYPDAYFNLGVVFQEQGCTEAALQIFQKLRSTSVEARWHELLFLPILYDTPEEIQTWRKRFRQGLQELSDTTTTLEKKQQALAGVGALTTFYLQYQGQNDKGLQQQYAHLVQRIMAANFPQWRGPLPLKALSPGAKIRVGYLSERIGGHAGVWWAIGWLKHHNREQFEVYCYHVGDWSDGKTQIFQQYSDVFRHLPGPLATVCQQICADQLHVLVFTDVGMTPRITQLCGLRLAPIQCAAWGHPITTGSPNIDYFLSSTLQEPLEAQEHYTERLICLPKIGVCYPRPVIPPLSAPREAVRRAFGFREGAVVYLSCQSFYKYLPQYDYLFPAIALGIPQAQFAFLPHSSPQVTLQFWERLQRAFGQVELQAEEFCVLIPRQNKADYWVADIFLDTLAWSAGNTALEALSCGLPIVTCPGAFMRGRHTYGMLQALGVVETIARDEEHYVQLAVRLGLDPVWRQAVGQAIQAGHERLYEDTTCVRALEHFYKAAVQGQTYLEEEQHGNYR
ncbi:O-linked N-acetylglucosamine transferase, SPINDLY family protein [Anthocerotibacter panamensis]|uniref:O-linked N-acetylglucosamine transferase, SPINDLY family protein n=1 Tax=Anthocerotibacter panamensis TaxID=2857077 RepID=UPI001C406AFA|nr:tetratricopeptide repeat protein [Anthocerotibacter panamensis]